MLTSKSNPEEFLRFFRTNSYTLRDRLENRLNKKYGHTFIKLIQRGEELPPIFGTYKVGDITLYGCAHEISHSRKGFDFERMAMFLIMKDLRSQKRIMVACTETPIIYSSHCISRYKERLGLEETLVFVDVCKEMFLAGCFWPICIHNNVEVYGTDINSRTSQLICAKGAFLGYRSSENDVIHAETFLSPNEFREDQQYMDADKNPSVKRWNQLSALHFKGKVTDQELYAEQNNINKDSVAIKDGQFKTLSPQESVERTERLEQVLVECPDFFELQADLNKLKAMNRIQRKGYR